MTNFQFMFILKDNGKLSLAFGSCQNKLISENCPPRLPSAWGNLGMGDLARCNLKTDNHENWNICNLTNQLFKHQNEKQSFWKIFDSHKQNC